MATSTIVTSGLPWYYYIKEEVNNFHIGIVDRNGDAITVSSIDIKIYFSGALADFTTEADTFYVPRSSEIALAKALAYEILLTNGITMRQYERDFNDEIDRMKDKKIRMTNSPTTVKLLKILP